LAAEGIRVYDGRHQACLFRHFESRDGSRTIR
jgi:hypothetical protein